MPTPQSVIQAQFDAYNARDLERFAATLHPEVELFRPPAPEPVFVGKPALTTFYATQRFQLPHLRAELLGRLVVGNKVIDHERIHGVREQPYEIAMVYEVAQGLIRRMWTHAAE